MYLCTNGCYVILNEPSVILNEVKNLSLTLLCLLALCACARQEPEAAPPTKAEEQVGPIPTELLGRQQMERLNDIGKRFLALLDAGDWEEEAIFLDAAVASLEADDAWEDGASTTFSVDAVPGEAHLQIDGPVSTLTLLRSGQVISTAYLHEDGAVDVHLQHYRYLSEAPAEGMSFGTTTLWKDGQIIASVEVTPTAVGVAYVEAQVLDGEAFIRGTLEDAAMQTLKLRLTPETDETDGRALAADLDACTALGLYYPDIDGRAAVVGIGPFHRKTRFDDYWTWLWEVRFPGGMVVPVTEFTSYSEMLDVTSALTTLRTQLANLLPHIYP